MKIVSGPYKVRGKETRARLDALLSGLGAIVHARRRIEPHSTNSARKYGPAKKL